MLAGLEPLPRGFLLFMPIQAESKLTRNWSARNNSPKTSPRQEIAFGFAWNLFWASRGRDENSRENDNPNFFIKKTFFSCSARRNLPGRLWMAKSCWWMQFRVAFQKSSKLTFFPSLFFYLSDKLCSEVNGKLHTSGWYRSVNVDGAGVIRAQPTTVAWIFIELSRF